MPGNQQDACGIVRVFRVAGQTKGGREWLERLKETLSRFVRLAGIRVAQQECIFLAIENAWDIGAAKLSRDDVL
jgi:hypothetical protein